MVSCLSVIVIAALLATGACSKKADVKSRVTELEQAFQAAPAPTPAPELNPNAPTDAGALVNAALTAVRANDYGASVIALQEVQRLPGVTANQLMAVQGAMEAITTDLVARAAKGDPQAKAALAALEKTRSQ